MAWEAGAVTAHCSMDPTPLLIPHTGEVFNLYQFLTK
jgi:hypothetical protein